MSCDFRSKESRRFYSLDQMQEVYDTLLVGSKLFVAAGYEGIKVYDVSNPAAIKYVLTKNLFDVVRGLGLYMGPRWGQAPGGCERLFRSQRIYQSV